MQYGRESHLMHIMFDGLIVDSNFVDVPIGTNQDTLDQIANERIDYLEGLNG